MEKKKIRFTDLDENVVNVFTDGSKTNDGVGSAYVIRGKKFTKRGIKGLHDNNSVFQAEVFAIIEACKHIKELKIENKTIKFYIDSQAAIKAMNKYIVKSKLVAEAKMLLNEICESNKVILIWIPFPVTLAKRKTSATS